MTTRNFSSQLPAVLQTEVWNKFFGATVDQVFSPGNSEFQNAYIGRKPPYNDPATDFYKVENSEERSFYQLEPTMTSMGSSGLKHENLMFYQDYVNYLKFQGVDTSDHNRIFSTDYYSWCPPINPHKLSNYNEYYWMPKGPPVLVYDIPSTEYVGTGSQTRFMVPETIEVADTARYAVSVDGDAVGAGATAKTYKKEGSHPNAKVNQVLPSVVFDLRNLHAFCKVIDGVIAAATAAATDHMFKTGWAIDGMLPPEKLTEKFVNLSKAELVTVITELKASGVIAESAPTELVVDLIINTRKTKVADAIRPQLDTLRYDKVTYEVIYGKGTYNSSNSLTGKSSYISNIISVLCDNGITEPISTIKNLYTTAVVGAVYTIKDFQVVFATPIEKGRYVDIWSNAAYENYINGKPSFRLPIPGKTFTPEMISLGEKVIDHTPELIRGMRVLIRDNGYTARLYQVDLVNQLIKLKAVDTTLVYREKPSFVTIERTDTRTQAAKWAKQNHWYHRSLVMFYDDNYSPIRANRPIVEFDANMELHSVQTGDVPLFTLYDYEGVSLSDVTEYPESKFNGSPVFGFKPGKGAPDTTLGFPVTWNEFGSIVFTDYLSASTAVEGVRETQKFCKINGVLKSNWNYAGKTTQDNAGNFWELPLNLSVNGMNSNFSDVSENDWVQHLRELVEGNKNVTSLENKDFSRELGSVIIQTKSSLLRSMLLASDDRLDLIKAITYNEKEYTRFRAKYNQTLTRALQNLSASATVDVTALVDSVLTQLASTKSQEFPFTNSGVAFGEWFIPATGSYLGCAPLYKPEITLEEIDNFMVVSVTGHDGSITRTPHVFPLTVTTNDGASNVIDTLKKDSIRIDGNIIDGVDMRQVSAVYDREWVDTKVVEPVQIIDKLNWAKSVFALEKRIYDSSVDKTKNRVDDFPLFNLLAPVAPGEKAAYSRDEFIAISKPTFEKWVATQNASYRKNNIFDSTNPFTWNYRGVKGVNGVAVPGYWRGIYQLYLGTDRPHTHPWEMLGFINKPVWWDTHYSWKEASKRAKLVAALADGVISDPGASVTKKDSRFAIGSIVDFIPVNTLGELLPPSQSLVPVVNYEQLPNAKGSWEYGDGSPTENKWRNSHSRSFTYSVISYLMRPAEFVEKNWISNDELNINGSWVRASTGSREIDTASYTHNETVDGNLVRVRGIQMWISDYLRSSGIDSTEVLGVKIRSITPKLAHKVGGFVNRESIRAFTENIGILQDEDISTVLYKSPVTKCEFYGGIIVEKAENGWRVFGYDVLSPAFSVFEPYESAQRISISVAADDPTSINDWIENTYYTVNTRVLFDNKAWRALASHTSSSTFEYDNWVQVVKPEADPTLRVTWPLDFDDEVKTVPYGTVFRTRQELSDFFAGYQEYLESRGWRFQYFDSNIGYNRDFALSIREFLLWAHDPALVAGMFISLSPASEQITFVADHGTVKNIEKQTNGVSSVINREGFSIPSSDITANRTEEQIVISTMGEPIYGIRVSVHEIEHAVVFNNSTIFGNVIYDPTFGLRQYRIRLSGMMSTSDWKGRLESPGFIIADNTMVPNFDRQVEDVRFTYGIEGAVSLPLRDTARHTAGYQARDYLNNLIYNEANQFEFYQGMIQQKGAPGVFNKLLRNSLLRQNHELSFLEEWAFRYGVYGGSDLHYFIEFELQKDEFKSNPQLIVSDSSLVSDFDGDQVITLYDRDARWLKPLEGRDMFPVETNYATSRDSLPNPGYVRLSETSYQFKSVASMNENKDAMATLEVGNFVWVYRDEQSHDWDVKVVEDLGALPNLYYSPSTVDRSVRITAVEAITSGARFFVNATTSNLRIGDLVYIDSVIKDTLETAYGFFPVVATGENYFELDILVYAEKVFTETEDWPSVKVLKSRRVSSKLPTDFNLINRSKGTVFTASSATYKHVVSNLGLTDQSVSGYVYFDVCYKLAHQHLLPEASRRWVVMYFDAATKTLTINRVQPLKVKSRAIADIKMYDDYTFRDNRKLIHKPVINSDILVWDPVSGLVPGIAEKEIAFKLNADPAEYNQGPNATVGSGSDWGPAQVGKLWWDTSTVFYLDAFTDTMPKFPGLQEPFTPEQRDAYFTKYSSELTELKYRTTNFGSLAPSASVDIYEWTKSYVLPSVWQEKFDRNEEPLIFDGSVYGGIDASYVESSEWDPNLGKDVPVYYFWVMNRKSTPRNSFREKSAMEVARILTNPSQNGLSLVSPLSENGFLSFNLGEVANSKSTIEFKVSKSDYEVNQHIEWKLLREGDERGTPDFYLWSRLVTSLSSRTVWGDIIPRSSLAERDRVGYEVLERGQSLFKDVQSARRHMTNVLNRIVSRNPILAARSPVSKLISNEVDTREIQWYQAEGSYFIKPAPHKNVWTFKTDNPMALDHSIGNQILYSFKPSDSHWSVMGGDRWDATFYGDQDEWDNVNLTWTEWKKGSWDFTENSEEWESFVWDGEAVENFYDVEADDESYLFTEDGFTDAPAKMRVLVKNTFKTGYWSIWEVVDGGNHEFKLLQFQRYKTSEVFDVVDWYNEGEKAAVFPYVEYSSIQDAVIALGPVPQITFVKINNQITGRWEWRRFIDGNWELVALEKGTIKFKDNLWKNSGNFDILPEFNTPLSVTVDVMESMVDQIKAQMKNRDMGYEINCVLNSLRDSFLTGIELNELFFDMVYYAHTEQDSIDWCFKTSFMYITGYSDQLRKMPIKYADLTSSVLDYINEVKPYHVKIRDFISKYRAPVEVANVVVTDFDLPPLYNMTTGTSRLLDYQNEYDLGIIMRTAKYKPWYNAITPILELVGKQASMRSINLAVEKSGLRRINVTRGNNIDENINYMVNEEITINVSRTTVDQKYSNGLYDVGVPFWKGVGNFTANPATYEYVSAARDHTCTTVGCKVKGSNVRSCYPLNCDGTVDFSKLTFPESELRVVLESGSEIASSWDTTSFDDGDFFNGDDANYKNKYLVVGDVSETYSGVVTTSKWDTTIDPDCEVIEDTEYDKDTVTAVVSVKSEAVQVLSSKRVAGKIVISKDTAPVTVNTEKYSIGSDTGWYDEAIEQPNGLFTLSPVRVLSAKKEYDYGSNAVYLHVAPKSGVVARLRIINNGDERASGKWIFHSPGTPIHPFAANLPGCLDKCCEEAFNHTTTYSPI